MQPSGRHVFSLLCILKLLVLVGARASARFGVCAGKTLKFPDRSGVLKLKRRKRRAPSPTTSGCAVFAQSVSEKWFAGSTGDPPVPSGDSPDGTGATVRANGHGLFATLLAAVPVGGSPTGAGGSRGSPAPPIFKT